VQIAPTYYFRPLSAPITLSSVYNITLRNPLPEELGIFQKNIKILSSYLSSKEQRRILYTLYPLGVPMPKGSLTDQFIQKLSEIWVLAISPLILPFKNSLIDYGYLCGYISDQTYLINPGGFISDIRNFNPRILLRALKKELPKAAIAIHSPNNFIPDLCDLERQGAYWDGLLLENKYQESIVQVAHLLYKAHNSDDILQRFLNYCIVIEYLITHNPHDKGSKMPLNRQFSNKLALIRHFMIKYYNQNNISSPQETQQLYNEIYNLRSQFIHGRIIQYSKEKLAKYINHLYPSLRLILNLQYEDPLFLEFIKDI